jgi:hypothetical protein
MPPRRSSRAMASCWPRTQLPQAAQGHSPPLISVTARLRNPWICGWR